MKHSSVRSVNRPSQRSSRGSSWARRLFSKQTLLRTVGGLLVMSAVMNLFYHSHLPIPRNDHITGVQANVPVVVHVEDHSHSTKSSTTQTPSPIAPLQVSSSTSSNSTAVSKTPDNDIPASINPPAIKEEASFQAAVTETTPPPPPPPPPPPTSLSPSNHTSDFLVWGSGVQAQQVTKTDKKGNVLHRSITTIKKEDLVGIGDDKVVNEGEADAELSLEEVKKGREELLAILEDAGVTDIDAASIAKLPTWSQVRKLYGDKPVVYGLDTCERFRNTIPKDDASVGTAGLFNTGTNPFAMYLSANCQMPEKIPMNKHDKSGGMRWQVPWGKHMLASRKWTNTAGNDEKVNKTNVLPVVLIRDPYSWMQSMCKHPYAASWKHAKEHCPNLVPSAVDREKLPNLPANATSIPVSIGYPGNASQWDSLAHVWSDWYNQYTQADYPRLMIRFEDILFHVREVITLVCECAGAVPKQDTFSYVVDSGKWGDAHKGSSNMISAMIKYGTDKKRFASFTDDDLRYAAKHVDPELLRRFQYEVPDVPSE